MAVFTEADYLLSGINNIRMDVLQKFHGLVARPDDQEMLHVLASAKETEQRWTRR